jgi:hypothetical protein
MMARWLSLSRIVRYKLLKIRLTINFCLCVVRLLPKRTLRSSSHAVTADELVSSLFPAHSEHSAVHVSKSSDKFALRSIWFSCATSNYASSLISSQVSKILRIGSSNKASKSRHPGLDQRPPLAEEQHQGFLRQRQLGTANWLESKVGMLRIKGREAT